MAKGRPPELPLDPEVPGPITQTVVHIDDRGRVQLPAKFLQGWERPSFALAVLAEPGKLRLLRWVDAGPAVLAKRRELIERATRDPLTLEILRALEDRYKRLHIPADCRPTLTAEMIAHLGVSLLADIYAWRVDQLIDLNSRETRLKELDVEFHDLEMLPH